jgi:ATP-dependent exoDNAse (exonuclease V) beta subunit
VLARASRADEVCRELPFTHVTDEGLMEGKIDLLFAEKGQWVLVDYKTDARVEVEKYVEQLRAYEAALQRVAGITLAQKLLFFLATGTVAQVP